MSYAHAFNVRFRCDAIDCTCDVEVPVRGCVTREGGRLYEYSSSACPRCGHKLFNSHQLLGEVARKSHS